MKLFHRKCGSGGIVHDNELIFRFLHTFEEKNTAKQLILWDFEVN